MIRCVKWAIEAPGEQGVGLLLCLGFPIWLFGLAFTGYALVRLVRGQCKLVLPVVFGGAFVVAFALGFIRTFERWLPVLFLCLCGLALLCLVEWMAASRARKDLICGAAPLFTMLGYWLLLAAGSALSAMG